MKKAVLLFIVLIALAACQQAAVDFNNTDTPNFTSEEPNVSDEGPVVVDKGKKPSELNYSVVVTGVEEEVIPLEPVAYDLDNDELTYTFSEPFDEDGLWQTKVGDAGEYLVTITASDGTNTTTQRVLVRVKPKNRLPVVNCPEKMTVREGETIRINCDIYDPEGNEVVVTYSGYIGALQHRVRFDEAGTHEVIVTAWDKQNVNDKVSRKIIIEVIDVNRPPEVTFDFGSQINAKEGDVVAVSPKINDPDGDKLAVTYSEPFGRNGIWRTEKGDAGVYEAKIAVSDGKDTVTKNFTVLIKESNTAPRLELIPDVSVDEGETVELDVKVSDREGDRVTTRITGFMDSRTYTTTYEDAYPDGCSSKGCTAVYTVTVTASDGRLETSQDVKVHVKDRNRPPVFRVPA